LVTRGNKFWIIVAFCSLLVYDLYWLINSLINPYYIPYNVPFFSVLVITDYVFPIIGEFLRFIGVTLALFSAYLAWGPKPKLFQNVKKKAAVVLLFEATYFLLLLPINILGISESWGALPIFIGFILQILLVSPLLIVLSVKVWRYKETAKENLLKWVGIVATGYLIGIWINNVFKWFRTTNVGFGYLLGGINSVNFVNSIILLSLSVIFAVVGFYTLSKKENKRLGIRWLAASLIMLGLHLVIFIVNHALADSLEWVLLTEIWPIVLLGLGLNMLRGEI
jgi:hypothetical protein